MFIEAYPVLSNLKIPLSVDWVGFDRYEIFDPTTNSIFLNDLDTLKAKLSTNNQRIFLVIDDQWLPYYGSAGFTPDTLNANLKRSVLANFIHALTGAAFFPYTKSYVLSKPSNYSSIYTSTYSQCTYLQVVERFTLRITARDKSCVTCVAYQRVLCF